MISLKELINFSVGNRWEEPFLDRIISLNQKYSTNNKRVSELYGSLRKSNSGLASARPDYRLPDISRNDFVNFTNKAKQHDIKINYTLNSPLNCTPADIHKNLKSILSFITFLNDSGVDTITVGNLLFYDVIRDYVKCEIEISSILNFSSVAQIPLYKEIGISKICVGAFQNRNFNFLINSVNYARKYDIQLKLMVNEFCTIGGAPCLGIYQTDCVLQSSLGGNSEKLFNGWPHGNCADSRNKNPASWLKSRFILPQWVDLYCKHTGINSFKITGRTCETNWLLKTVESYLSNSFHEDIRLLWKDPGLSTEDHPISEKALTADYLIKNKFLDHWFKGSLAPCHEICGLFCNYCNDFYERTI